VRGLDTGELDVKIDAMMVEIRKDHPDVWIYEPRGEFVVRAGRSSSSPTLGRAFERYEAVYSALKAVRKARPKPMTVAEAKELVKAKAADSKCMKDASGLWFVSSLTHPYWVDVPSSESEGQAWKAAAAAIQAEEKAK
jgi:hypothetical protein